MLGFDPYEVLGVPEDATQADIEIAYRDAVKKHHPDKGGDEEKFNEVITASLILRDAKRRKKFDEEGIVDEDKPERIHSAAIEQIAQFFINSIEAVIASNQNMSQFNLVQGGNLFFDQKISDHTNRINEANRRVKNFEKVLKRLKAKKESDIISKMLKSHLVNFNNEIENVHRQIKICKRAKEVLKDYEFEQEAQSLLLPNAFGWNIRQ